MTEWADDAGSSWWQPVRCIEGAAGCGWNGKVRAIMLLGATDYEIDDCPECSGEIEEMEGYD